MQNISSSSHPYSSHLSIWLSLCLLLVAAMVLVGGYTRLSGSGLSITQWKPIHGVIPPISEVDWQDEFSSYKATPQFALVNSDMTLEGFKQIFWPEFIHRLLARFIGFFFFFPLVYFAVRRQISKQRFWKLAGIFALGGLQGAIGWIMVASGLVDSPYVSPIKLALHLGVAFIIFALILWQLLEVVASDKWQVASKEKSNLPLITYHLPLILIFSQIIIGAVVAGMHAGLVYNTWPDMNGQFLPDNIMQDDHALVQFIHRTLAILVAVSFPLWWWVNRSYIRAHNLAKNCALVLLVILFQFALGVATLLLQVPLNIALAHQMNALLLWAAAIWLWHKMAVSVGGVSVG